MERIGRYLIEKELGRGAMGVVFLATDPALGRPVVIKTIRLGELGGTQDRRRVRERLLQEARLAAALSHPNIVTVYDAGEQGELTYIAMEYVNGPTLEQLLERKQSLEPEVLFRVLREAASALDYAHSKGIVHRDVKPANIMLQDSGAVKITDFGIAKIQASPLATQAGLVLGTPSYMSPEQALGRPVDGRSDQFSLAVVAFELLTGEKPFLADEIPAVLYKIAHEAPPSAQALNPTLGWPVDVVLRRALEKGPAARYPSCTEFVTALEAACRSSKGWRPLPRGSSQSLPTVAAAPVAAGPMAEEPAGRGRRAEGRRRDVVVTLFSALVTIGLISLAVMWFLGRGQHPAPPTAPAVATDEDAAGRRPSPAGPRVAAPEQPSASAESPEALTTKPIQPATAPEGEAASPPGASAESSAGASAPAARTAPTQAKPTPAARGTGEDTVVTFTTTPVGATVVVSGGDGTRKCVSPCALTLPPGRYTVAATLAGYRTALRIFTIPDEPDIAMALVRMTGRVRISSDPPGATIYVDGQRQGGVTPATLELPTGKHTIEVVLEGYARSREEIEVKDNAFGSLSFTLGR